MKNTTFILILSIFCANILSAQCPQRTVLGSTVNNWDWRVPQYKVNISDNSPREFTYITSPFESSPSQPNLSAFSDTNIKDYDPEDGWELVLKNFGDSLYNTNRPFFVLYNRYESRMRLFFYHRHPDGTQSSQAGIHLFFSTNRPYQTALLEHINGVSNSVEDQAKGIIANIPNHAYSSYVWLHTDISVAYDPCTCAQSSLLRLSITTSPVNNVLLKMKGSDETIRFIVKNDQIERLDGLKDIVPWYNNNGGLQGFTSIPEFKRFFEDIIGSRLATQTPVNDLKNTLPQWAANQMENEHTNIGHLDFMLAGGKKEAINPMPMASFSSTYFESYNSLRPLYTLGEYQFALPGSNTQGLSPTLIPLYNNILGTFNLLETPTLFHSTDYPTEGEGRGRKISTRLRYKLEEDISYVINPASGLSQAPESIRGALFFTFKKNNALQPQEGLIKEYELKGGDMVTYRTPYLPLGCLNEFVATFQSTYNRSFILPESGDIKAVLQLVVNLKRDTLTDPFPNKTANNVLFVSKYAIKEAIATKNIAPNELLSIIPFDRTVENISLTQNTTLYAWNTIKIGKNINTNGYTLVLIANNEVKNVSNAPLPSNISIEIGTPAPCARAIPAKEATYIADFCGSSRYNPLQYVKYPPVADTSSSTTFTVFPNPAQNHARIEIGVRETTNSTLFMTDILGRNVENLYFSGELQRGTTHFDLNIQNLERGFYFITLKKENGELKTLRFIKE
jgi:hypothetical protein